MPRYAKTRDFEEATYEDRYVTCPECKIDRWVENDATYEFTCEGCGVICKCRDLIEELTMAENGWEITNETPFLE